jgi:hypothetical protein
MIYKNCALLKRSFTAVALVGALLNTTVYGMDEQEAPQLQVASQADTSKLESRELGNLSFIGIEQDYGVLSKDTMQLIVSFAVKDIRYVQEHAKDVVNLRLINKSVCQLLQFAPVNLPYLRHFDQRLTDTVLAQLVRFFPCMDMLGLYACKNISEDGLILIQHLSKLTNLDMGCFTKFTDASLEPLRDLTQLTSLRMNNLEQTGIGIGALQGLTKLQSLVLGCCMNQERDSGLEHLKDMQQLTELDLGHNVLGIKDNELKHLTGITNLVSLNLWYCKNYTDTGLNYLTSLVNLTDLNVADCDGITGAGIDSLKAHLPNVQIKLER